MRRGSGVDSIGHCGICGHEGPGPEHECIAVVHLLKTRGGTACGADEEADDGADADINRVTCKACEAAHDRAVNLEPVQPPSTEFRLPDGAQFSCMYNAERIEWSVQLIIPAKHDALANHGQLRFAANGRGLFMTLAKVDRQYRKEMCLPAAKRGSKGGAKKGKQL